MGRLTIPHPAHPEVQPELYQAGRGSLGDGDSTLTVQGALL